MSAEAPNTVLSQLTKESLIKMAKQDKIDVSMKDTKSKILKALTTEIEDASIKQLTSAMKKAELEELVNELKIEVGKGVSTTKTVLQKRLVTAATKDGLENFFSALNASQLKVFIRAASEEPTSNKKEELLEQATGLFHLVGLSTYLSNFSVPFLQECMGQIGLKCDTDSKQKIVLAIATQTNAKKEALSRDIEFSKTKLKITKGITYQDIFQHYLLEELVDYCRDNELKVSGTKPEIINRILDFLDGDLENTKAVNTADPPAKKQRKATDEKEKPNKKAKTDVKDKAKPKESKSEENEKPKEKAKDKSKAKKEGDSKPKKSTKEAKKPDVEEDASSEQE